MRYSTINTGALIGRTMQTAVCIWLLCVLKAGIHISVTSKGISGRHGVPPTSLISSSARWGAAFWRWSCPRSTSSTRRLRCGRRVSCPTTFICCYMCPPPCRRRRSWATSSVASKGDAAAPGGQRGRGAGGGR